MPKNPPATQEEPKVCNHINTMPETPKRRKPQRYKPNHIDTIDTTEAYKPKDPKYANTGQGLKAAPKTCVYPSVHVHVHACICMCMRMCSS